MQNKIVFDEVAHAAGHGLRGVPPNLIPERSSLAKLRNMCYRKKSTNQLTKNKQSKIAKGLANRQEMPG